MNKNENEWRDKEVRLFPSISIKSEREAELRATAALLTVIRAVSEFGRRIVRLSKGPGLGNLSCYNSNGNSVYRQISLKGCSGRFRIVFSPFPGH